MAKKTGERLTHVDEAGRARMVDVGEKPEVLRLAEASAIVTMSAECARMVAENEMKKGDVLAVAEVAGVMAAKKTSELVPLCHPLRLDKVRVSCCVEGNQVSIRTVVSCRERTGVEMEALTAAAVAAVTIFDMCKAVDPKMVIGPIRVERKEKK